MPEASSIAVVPSATDRSEPSGSVIVMSAMGGEATVALLTLGRLLGGRLVVGVAVAPRTTCRALEGVLGLGWVGISSLIVH